MSKVELSLEEYEQMKDKINQLENQLNSCKTSYNHLNELLKVIAPEPLQIGILSKLKPHMVSINIATDFERLTRVFHIKYELPESEVRDV